MSLKMGLDFSGTLKTLFLISQKYIKMVSKATYFYTTRRDLSIGAFLAIFEEKTFSW
jgi:hypothetical protein